MNKKLAGVCFVRLGVELGYCFEASIQSMKLVCDTVIVTYCESTDETWDVLSKIDDIVILKCSEELWQSQHGKDKLSYFQNISIDYAEKQGYDYVLLVQADEILHPDSIPYIKRALELEEEAYFCSRYNLWKDGEHMLNVPQHRKPCSSVVNRLTKAKYRSVSDGESIASDGASLDFINLIEIFHMGFIRDKKKHIAKIKEIQKNIFAMENYDPRADLKEEFDWQDWGFTEDDLVRVPKRLPVGLQKYL
jgi:hypothetical protein